MAAIAIDNKLGLPFTDQELTESINTLPNKYGRLEKMGMFPRQSISTTVVEARLEGTTISLLPTVERGGNSTPAQRDKGKSIFFKVPHIPHLETITPADIQDINRVVGGSRGKATLESEINKRLEKIRFRHDVTLEYMRNAALKGILVDGAGTTLYNFFDAFGITKKTIAFALGTAGTDVLGKCNEVIQWVEDNLQGEISSGVEALVDTAFFDKLIDHVKVKDKFLSWQAAMSMSQPTREDATGGATGRVFTFGGITFREARGSMTLYNGTTKTALMAASSGQAFPVGTSDTFATYDAPPHRMSEVNAPPGEAIYISQEVLKHDKGIELDSESNPLPLVRRPALLVELTTN